MMSSWDCKLMRRETANPSVAGSNLRILQKAGGVLEVLMCITSGIFACAG